MKKLLAITVIFALVAGAAFAETQVGGSIEVNWNISEGILGEGMQSTKADIAGVAFFLSTENDEGTFGGMGKFAMHGYGTNGQRSWEAAPTYLKFDRVFAWWKPIEQLKIFLGKDGDGLFNTANLIRWGHHQMPRNISVEDWQAGNYLLGNWDRLGVAFMIYPIEGLEINLALDLPGDDQIASWMSNPTPVSPGGPVRDEVKAGEDGSWTSVPNAFQAQVGYNLDGVGKFILTYQGNGRAYRYDIGTEDQVGNRIGLTYQSASFVEGLSFEVGGSYNFLDSNDEALRVAFGVHYANGDFGVKTRFFLHPNRYMNAGADNFFYFLADLMPYYSFSFGTIYCNFRIETANDEDLNFHINPYIRVNVGVGDLRFGMRFDGSSASNSDLKYLIATSFVVNF